MFSLLSKNIFLKFQRSHEKRELLIWIQISNIFFGDGIHQFVGDSWKKKKNNFSDEIRRTGNGKISAGRILPNQEGRLKQEIEDGQRWKS